MKNSTNTKKFCPKCGAEIYHLLNLCPGNEVYVLTSDGEYIYKDFLMGSGEVTWACPECMEDLFYSEEQALSFLRQGKAVKETP